MAVSKSVFISFAVWVKSMLINLAVKTAALSSDAYSVVKAIGILLGILGIWVGSAFFHMDLPYTDFTLYGWHFYALATVLRFMPNEAMQRWGLNFWLWTDQGVNVLLGGNCDVTVSSKVGYMKLNGSKTAIIMAVVIDTLWYIGTGQLNHCVEAIEHDEVHY